MSATEQGPVLPDDRTLQVNLSKNPLRRGIGSKDQRNRTGNQFKEVLREMAKSSANRIESINLLHEPFPNVQRYVRTLDKL